MLKKIVAFILVNLLWPILRELLTDVLKHFIRAAMSAIQGLMKKWEKEEIARAEDPAEIADIEKKYSDRQSDMDALKEKLSTASEKIVEDALKQGENLRTELLSTNSSTLQKLEAPKEAPGGAT
jgi:hypothetical protein